MDVLDFFNCFTGGRMETTSSSTNSTLTDHLHLEIPVIVPVFAADDNDVTFNRLRGASLAAALFGSLNIGLSVLVQVEGWGEIGCSIGFPLGAITRRKS